MYCWKCGKENKDGISRCVSCGVDLLRPDSAETGNNTADGRPTQLLSRVKKKSEKQVSDSEDAANVPLKPRKKRWLKRILIVLLVLFLLAIGIFIYAVIAPYHLHYVIECIADDLGIRSFPKSQYTDENGVPITPTMLLTPAPIDREMITFGRYEQDDIRGNGTEEIEWYVLDREGTKALLVSRSILDCQPYNAKKRKVTWKTCALRSWLNGTFIEEAFTPEEREKILTVTVNADWNAYSDVDPGNPTQDRVFLLSTFDAERFFSSDEERICVPTKYALAKGVYDWRFAYAGCEWWLRSTGDSYKQASYVMPDGFTMDSGKVVNDDVTGVRPAMWIETE